MKIQRAKEQSREDIITLLQKSNLPTADLPVTLDHFLAAVEEDRVVGLIGIEHYGSYGLLRSMVVHPDHRNKQIAETLVNLLESNAREAGITDMFLLTETAENYFNRKGYNAITRDEVPPEVKSSSEFSHVCPVSAVVMRKKLT